MLRKDVRVQVHRDRELRVAQDRLDVFCGYALCVEERGAGVAQIMKAARWYLCSLPHPVPMLYEIAALDGRADARRENEVVIMPYVCREPFRVLIGAVFAQGGHGERGEWDDGTTAARLQFPQYEFALDSLCLGAYGNRLRFEVYIAPPQTEEFTLSQPSRHGSASGLPRSFFAPSGVASGSC